MNKIQIEDAIHSGAPFSIRMVDGKEYHIPHQDYISISPTGTFAIVYDDEGHYFVLPFRTVTGIVSTIAEAEG